VLTSERAAVDLRRPEQVERFVAAARPDCVVIAAARVGGILANDRFPADFLVENLQIQTNVVASAHESGVARLLFLGSSCIYPKFAEQPLREDALLSGPLEPTNQWYAIAKIAGVKMIEAYRRQHGRDYISAMPSNLYGPGDNFDPQSSHVLPALIRKAHEAKMRRAPSLTIWGSGTPRREFLHVDDCADALVFLLKNYSGDSHVNLGVGRDISIIDLTQLVCAVVGFDGRIEHDTAKPDGTPRKLLSVDRLHSLGWRARIVLEEGIAATYRWYLDHLAREDVA
jgi:GDP-L-fucose synthase